MKKNHLMLELDSPSLDWLFYLLEQRITENKDNILALAYHNVDPDLFEKTVKKFKKRTLGKIFARNHRVLKIEIDRDELLNFFRLLTFDLFLADKLSQEHSIQIFTEPEQNKTLKILKVCATVLTAFSDRGGIGNRLPPGEREKIIQAFQVASEAGGTIDYDVSLERDDSTVYRLMRQTKRENSFLEQELQLVLPDITYYYDNTTGNLALVVLTNPEKPL